MNELEQRPVRREYGNTKPTMIAALLRHPKVAAALERRYPGNPHVVPVYDAEGRVIDFRPSPRDPIYGRHAAMAVRPSSSPTTAAPARRGFKSFGTLVREQRLQQVMLRQVGR